MKQISLEQIIDFKNGKIPPKEKGIIPIYGGNGILGYTTKFNYENVIIIGRVGAYCGSVHIEKGKCWVSDNAIAGVHKNVESNEYNYYLLKTISLNKKQIGSSQPLLTQGILNTIDLKIHRKDSVQKEIGLLLSSLDSKIELNNRINAELERLAKTLYDYWFVQFDFPNEAGKPYKTSGGCMVWNAELKREIPDGWEVKKLEKFCNTTRGVTYNKNDILKPNAKDSIPILRATNINNNEIDLNEMVYLPQKLISESQKLQKFDVLITMSSGSKAHVGKNAFFYFDKEISFGAFCAKITFDKNIRFFMFTHMQSVDFKKYISNVCLGTSINNLTNEHITGYKVLVPSNNQLLNFEEIVEKSYKKIANNLIENRKLAELQDWLLPMLMNGQVKVNS